MRDLPGLLRSPAGGRGARGPSQRAHNPGLGAVGDRGAYLPFCPVDRREGEEERGDGVQFQERQSRDARSSNFQPRSRPRLSTVGNFYGKRRRL